MRNVMTSVNWRRTAHSRHLHGITERLTAFIQLVILLNCVGGCVYAFFLNSAQSQEAQSDSQSGEEDLSQQHIQPTLTDYNQHDASFLKSRQNSTNKNRNLCYCSYGPDVCDYAAEVCVKHDLAACFHAVRQVYTVKQSGESNSDGDYDYVDDSGGGRHNGVGVMEMRHFYGCTPLERGTNASHLTCNSWRAIHSSPSSIVCCYEGNFCNVHLKTPAFAVTDRLRGGEENKLALDGASTTVFLVVILLFVSCAVFIVVITLLVFAVARHRRKRAKKLPNCVRNLLTKFDDVNDSLLSKINNGVPPLKKPLSGNDAIRVAVPIARLEAEGFEDGDEMSLMGGGVETTTGSGSGSGGARLNQRTIAQDLTLLETVARGRYGEVRKAQYRGSVVAVKIFYTTEEDSWRNERDIYQTQMLNHENILQYVAADISSNVDSLTQMMLVTDYHANGSLYDYLRERRCDCRRCYSDNFFSPLLPDDTKPFPRAHHPSASYSASSEGNCRLLSAVEALQLAHSIASGVEHLHSAVRGTGGRRKPEIAHRDIKSKNVIVKRPGVCCIADFGLAVRRENYIIIPERINIQVGTKRYMAPEVLARTLNVTNFDEFKYADIYSFALVLWEILQMVQITNDNLTSRGDVSSMHHSCHHHHHRRFGHQNNRAKVTGGRHRASPKIVHTSTIADVMACGSPHVRQNVQRENTIAEDGAGTVCPVGCASWSSSGIATGASDRSGSATAATASSSTSNAVHVPPHHHPHHHRFANFGALSFLSGDTRVMMTYAGAGIANGTGACQLDNNTINGSCCGGSSIGHRTYTSSSNSSGSCEGGCDGENTRTNDAFVKDNYLNTDAKRKDDGVVESSPMLRQLQHCSVGIGRGIYLLPYQMAVDSDPSFDEMRRVVCDEKLRPIIRPEWTETAILRQLCELMRECWSETPTSRHTSLKMKIELLRMLTALNVTEVERPPMIKSLL